MAGTMTEQEIIDHLTTGANPSPMTQDQEAHLARIKSQFCSLVDDKYRKGQAEHGGDLFRHPLIRVIDEAIAEVLDLATYLFTAREKITQLKEL